MIAIDEPVSSDILPFAPLCFQMDLIISSCPADVGAALSQVKISEPTVYQRRIEKKARGRNFLEDLGNGEDCWYSGRLSRTQSCANFSQLFTNLSQNRSIVRIDNARNVCGE